MNSLSLTFGCALLLSAGAGLWPALAEAPVLDVRPAQKFSFPSTAGQAYQIQSSEDGAIWTDVGEVIWGNGGTVDRLYARNSLPAGARQFRVQAVDGNEIGPATSTLAGKSVSLNHNGLASNYVFLTNSKGLLHRADDTTRSFTCTLNRISSNTLRASLQFANHSETLELVFSTLALGTFVQTRGGNATTPPDDNAGGFSVSDGVVWTAFGGSDLPATLKGTSLALAEPEGLCELFFDETTGFMRREGEPLQSFSYTYDLGGNGEGQIILDFGGGRTQEINLDLVSPGTGLAEFQNLAGGVVQGSGNTTFNRPVPSGGGAPNPEIDCPAPESAEDLDMSDIISGSATYTFDSGSGGQKVTRNGGSIEFTPFSFGYRRIDDLHAQLVITFPSLAGDEIEVIDLTYSGDEDCSGTFKKQVYRNGAPAGPPVSGSFGPGNPPPSGARVRFLF